MDDSVAIELRRLIRAGVADLAYRPARYPRLTAVVTLGGRRPLPLEARVPYLCTWFWPAVLQQMRDDRERRTAEQLLGLLVASRGLPLQDRRELADAVWSHPRRGRRANTFYKEVEPRIVEALEAALDTVRNDSTLSDATDEPLTVAEPLVSDDWEQRIELAAVFVSQQSFAQAEALLLPWIAQADASPADVDLYLLQKTLLTMGNSRRDQGILSGAIGARQLYCKAAALRGQRTSSAITGRADLYVTLVDEMERRDVVDVVKKYQVLSDDRRLTEYDRFRALLWSGTAVTLLKEYSDAVGLISRARDELSAHGFDQEAASASFKLAIAYALSEDKARAEAAMISARRRADYSTPLSRVRVDVATGRVLLKLGGEAEGLRMLDTARQVAEAVGLGHQLRSIHELVSKRT